MDESNPNGRLAALLDQAKSSTGFRPHFLETPVQQPLQLVNCFKKERNLLDDRTKDEKGRYNKSIWMWSGCA
jgi:hypothetical protein